MKLLEETARMPHSDAEVLLDDRRWNERSKLLKNVRVSRAGASDSEEVGTAIDISRDGLYFTAALHDYEIGMELRLTLPDSGTEWSCEVVRTEQLPGGRVGVGVRVFGRL